MTASTTPVHITHRGGCHCRRVRYEVDAPAAPEVLECNCSICTMTGFLHLIVPAARFRLLSGARISNGDTRRLRWKSCTHYRGPGRA